MFACERSHIGVSPDVFFEHGRFLAANSTLRANVAPPSSSPYISILLVAFKAAFKTFDSLVANYSHVTIHFFCFVSAICFRVGGFLKNDL